MNKMVFQEVFDLIQDFLPNNWKKTVLFVGYTKGSYSMKFYCGMNKDEFVDCFNLEGASKSNLIKLFMKIDKILSKERESLDDKNRWSVLTMIIDSNGNMKTEFDYEDHSEDLISYEKAWKKKYL